MSSPVLKARMIRLRQIASKLAGRPFDPYPTPPASVSLQPHSHVERRIDATLPTMAWERRGTATTREWQETARLKLLDLTGARIKQGPDAADPAILMQEAGPSIDGISTERLILEIGPDHPVVVTMLEPSGGADDTFIIMQGTNAGAHLSWGEARMPPDPIKIANGNDIALQAVRNGYRAICLELPCFGERRERKFARGHPCASTSNHLLHLGTCLTGYCVEEVAALTRFLKSKQARWSTRWVFAAGHSYGGTVATYAGALCPDLDGVLSSGSVGFLRETVLRRNDESGQSVVPGQIRWLETDDVVGLIAPRPFLGVSGIKDHIWPFSQCEAVTASATRIYADLDAGDMILNASGPGGHRFYEAIAWPAWNSLVS